jgi:hypothetical protein
MVFVVEFSIFSKYSVVLLVLGLPDRLSFSTDIQPALKRECHSKTTVLLKGCSQKSLMKHFKGFSSKVTKIHANLDADLLDFIIHHRQNKTQS